MRRLLLAPLILLVLAPAAHATPVATSDDQYQALGRVFPDPMGGCQQIGSKPCSPNAQGNLPATQFIGYNEFVAGMKYLNSKPEWRRYLEVLPLDGKIDADDGTAQSGTDGPSAFPGNNLPFEFTPKPEYRSVGIPTTGNGRKSVDLYAVRVTDETVPDAGKKRFTWTLSIHGIERAGAEGGTRAIEDLVTAFTTQRANQKIVPDGTLPNAPTFADVLKKAIIYFVYPNPDGWQRGSVSQGGVFFQRYNGNGVDLNRDWPDVGFAFRPYSGLSEPETRGISAFYKDVYKGGERPFAAGADLHGQLTADALSYTLLGHGRHDYAKDTRVRETAKAIHKVSEKALAWSPLIVPNDTPKSQNGCSTPVTGDSLEACAQIYGQTWGTVYDTINYTTTGALGDWMDSPIGLNTDGLDNEMSFSHLDRNIVFDPQGEQLHVDGNKALIYAQITQTLNPPTVRFTAPGKKGYVANARLKHAEENFNVAPPAGTVAQPDIVGQSGSPGPGQVVFDFPVLEGPQPDGKKIFNGGLRVDITKLNVQGISDGNAVTTLKVQCRYCDDHPGVKADSDGFVTVAEDYNQSPAYAQGGLTAAVNRPMASNRAGKKVEWRALLESGSPIIDGGARMDVRFSQGPATVVGDTSGAPAPKLAAYDVANTDVFNDLNKSIADKNDRFDAIDVDRIESGADSLDDYTSIVIADRDAVSSRFRDRLRAWVRGGGNLVLTDSALRELPEFVDVGAPNVGNRIQYVGQVSFAKETQDDDAATIKDPLATSPTSVVQDGARFNSHLRRQTYEPTPLGYSIQYTNPAEGNVGDDHATSPAFDVDRKAFEKAGGRTVATGVEGGDTGEAALLDRTAMGEVKLGAGKVRFIGALLPEPTEKYTHDFGLEPYALTYTGHILLRNLLETPARAVHSTGPGAPGFKAASCPGSGGFTSARAVARGRGARFSFARRVRERVSVDVFQTSIGRRVIRERLVARYPNRIRSFSWNGRATVKRRKVTDGYYFVRYRMRLPNGTTDVRRVVLRRSHGRFRTRPSFYRRASCGLVASYKLLRPVFGGRNRSTLGVSYRLSKSARVGVTVLRGRRVVARFRTAARRPGHTYRLRFPARGRARGDYRFRLTAVGKGKRLTATLTSRRL